MLEKLLKIKADYTDINRKLGEPGVTADRKHYEALTRKEAQLRPIVGLIERYEKVVKTLAEAEAILAAESDAELLTMAKADLAQGKVQKEQLEKELKVALLPRDPKDDKNVIMEIRAGAGGEEASLFASELARMYMRYTENHGFKTELMSRSDADAGGVKEIIFRVVGQGAYSRLKYESGVHRVQRVPVTEAQGRIHTSTATVAVLPEAEEVDIAIKEGDLRIDVYRSGGHGGQGVNTTDSAVRLTHLATGLVVICQDERSQLKNRAKAMAVLRSRLYQLEEDNRARELGETRLGQIGTGERHEKIRTYNFPQDRLTDHRVKQNWSNLPAIMDGDLDDLIEKLSLDDQAQKLAVLGS